jgi:hypothetical protein
MSKSNTEVLSDSQFEAMKVNLDTLVVDDDWNNRVSLSGPDKFHKGTEAGGDQAATSGQSVEDLAKLIDQSKNFVPVTVSLRPDGTQFLIAGFRRVKAAKLLGWKIVPAVARAMTPAQEVEWNVLENAARKDLSTYETARGVVRMADALEAEGKSRKGGIAKGGKGAEGYGSIISKRLGMSRTAVNLYIRIFRQVRKEILESWATNPIPLTLMDQWASEEPREQLKKFKAWQGGEGEGDEGEGGEGGDGKGGEGKADGKPKRPSKAMVVYAMAMAADLSKSKEIELKVQGKAMLEALEWIQGGRKRLNGLDIAAEMKKDKKAAQEAAKAEKEDEESAEA